VLPPRGRFSATVAERERKAGDAAAFLVLHRWDLSRTRLGGRAQNRGAEISNSVP